MVNKDTNSESESLGLDIHSTLKRVRELEMRYSGYLKMRNELASSAVSIYIGRENGNYGMIDSKHPVHADLVEFLRKRIDSEIDALETIIGRSIHFTEEDLQDNE